MLPADQVMNPAYTAGAPDNSVGEPFSAAALSHVSTDRINPLLSATTPEQLALIFQMAEAQASALPPASAAPAAPGKPQTDMCPHLCEFQRSEYICKGTEEVVAIRPR